MLSESKTSGIKHNVSFEQKLEMFKSFKKANQNMKTTLLRNYFGFNYSYYGKNILKVIVADNLEF